MPIALGSSPDPPGSACRGRKLIRVGPQGRAAGLGTADAADVRTGRAGGSALLGADGDGRASSGRPRRAGLRSAGKAPSTPADLRASDPLSKNPGALFPVSSPPHHPRALDFNRLTALMRQLGWHPSEGGGRCDLG